MLSWTGATNLDFNYFAASKDLLLFHQFDGLLCQAAGDILSQTGAPDLDFGYLAASTDLFLLECAPPHLLLITHNLMSLLVSIP